MSTICNDCWHIEILLALFYKTPYLQMLYLAADQKRMTPLWFIQITELAHNAKDSFEMSI